MVSVFSENDGRMNITTSGGDLPPLTVQDLLAFQNALNKNMDKFDTNVILTPIIPWKVNKPIPLKFTVSNPISPVTFSFARKNPMASDWHKRKRYSWFIEEKLDKLIKDYVTNNHLTHQDFYTYRADHAFSDKYAASLIQQYGEGPHDMAGKQINIGDKLLIGSSGYIAIGNVSRIKKTPAGVAVYRASDPFNIQIVVTEHTYKSYIGKKTSGGKPERMLLL